MVGPTCTTPSQKTQTPGQGSPDASETDDPALSDYSNICPVSADTSLPASAPVEALQMRGICHALLHGDHPRYGRMACAEHQAEKSFHGLGIAGGSRHAVQGGPSSIRRPVEIMPLLFDFDVRLADPVRVRGGVEPRATVFIEFRGIAQRKRHRFMCSYSVVKRCSFQSGHSKEGTRWDTSHKSH